MQLTTQYGINPAKPYHTPSPDPYIQEPADGFATVEIMKGDFGPESGEVVTIRNSNGVTHVRGQIGDEDIDYRLIRWTDDGVDFQREVGDLGEHSIDMTTKTSKKDGVSLTHKYGVKDGKRTDLTSRWTNGNLLQVNGLIDGFDADYQAVKTDSWRVFGDFGEFEGDYTSGQDAQGDFGKGNFGDRIGEWRISSEDFETDIHTTKYQDFESRIKSVSDILPVSGPGEEARFTFTDKKTGFYGEQKVDYTSATSSFLRDEGQDSSIFLESLTKVEGNFGNSEGSYEKILLTVPVASISA